MSPEEWTARMLNKLFKTQGVTGEYGRITAATIYHGEHFAELKANGFKGNPFER